MRRGSCRDLDVGESHDLDQLTPVAHLYAVLRRKSERQTVHDGVDELERLGATLSLAETGGLPWDVDEDKPKAKHLARSVNRCTVRASALRRSA